MRKPIFLFLLLSTLAYAQSYIISTIPLPKSYVQNLDPYPCDETCLNDLIKHEQIFSFLAHAQGKVENRVLNDERLIYVSLFNIGSFMHSTNLRIALLLPSKLIGRYAASTTNSVFSYMLTKNKDFSLKTFQIDDESPQSIHNALQRIQQEQFYYVIAPLTHNGVQSVVDIDPEINVYFPTINKHEIESDSSSLFFGGIDYKAQTEKLMRESTEPLVIFYDNSLLGKRLRDYAKTAYNSMDQVDDRYENSQYIDASKSYRYGTSKKVFHYPVGKYTSNLERQLKNNNKIQDGTFFLNTPIIKSGLVMSQLTLFDVNVTNILSTQINYDPLILSITQAKDRHNLIIANSINLQNNIIIESNALMGNDIVYDWINYATTVGIDYFFHLITKSKREYELLMVDNQIIYPITLVQPSYSRFTPYIQYDDHEEY